MPDLLDTVCNLSYVDILKLDEEEQRTYLPLFQKILLEIDDSVYSDYKSLKQMFFESENIKEDIGDYLFTGKQVKYYPINKTRKLIKNTTCAVSGEVLHKGNEISVYKAFIYLPKDKVSYVSKEIKTHPYYSDLFPRDYLEFEEFCYRLDTSYQNNDEIYYNIETNIKGMSLRRLKKK